jgi:hypothetical protein
MSADLYYSCRECEASWGGTERRWICQHGTDRRGYATPTASCSKRALSACAWIEACPECGSREVSVSDEPPGAGADPFGRPDPRTHPEYWTE